MWRQPQEWGYGHPFLNEFNKSCFVFVSYFMLVKSKITEGLTELYKKIFQNDPFKNNRFHSKYFFFFKMAQIIFPKKWKLSNVHLYSGNGENYLYFYEGNLIINFKLYCFLVFAWKNILFHIFRFFNKRSWRYVCQGIFPWK